jgi:hypothetical protein
VASRAERSSCDVVTPAIGAHQSAAPPVSVEERTALEMPGCRRRILGRLSSSLG